MKDEKLTAEEVNCYVRKEMRTYLGDLSKIAFGSRGKWRKLADRLALTVDKIKEQMEAIVNYRLEKHRDARKEVRPTKAKNDAREIPEIEEKRKET